MSELPNGDLRYVLEFEIPALPPMNTAATRRHHMQVAREAARWRDAVCLVVHPSRRPLLPLHQAIVTMTRHSSVRPDYGNLVHSFKPILDGLQISASNRRGRWIARADVIEDDSPDHILEVYRWKRAAPGAGRVEIRVEERTVAEFARDRRRLELALCSTRDSYEYVEGGLR